MMKALHVGSIAFATAILIGCKSTGAPPPSSGTTQLCDGVNKMVAQELSAKYDVTNSRTIATNLNAAAQADVTYLRALKEGKVEAGAQAKLGTEIKAVIETKTAVTTDYFQQDDTFAKTICWYNEELSMRGLTEDDRAFWNARKRELALNRTEYLDVLTGLKKK